MASPTPSADQVQELIEFASNVVAESKDIRGRYRRRSAPGDPDRRAALTTVHAKLVLAAEQLRRERIRAARLYDFNERYGFRLASASHWVKRERYSVYRMLNPGGTKWRT